jgi:hypothetical protein
MMNNATNPNASVGLYHSTPTARPATHHRPVARPQIATIATSNANGAFCPVTIEAVLGAQASAASTASPGVRP